MLPYLYKIPIRELVILQKGIKPHLLMKKPFTDSVPYLDINALESGNFKEYTYSELGNISTEKDILVVWDGSRSGLVLKGKYGVIGSTLMALTPIGIDSDYLYYFLKSQFDYINGNTSGTGIPHVNTEIFLNLEIPYIPIAEQKNIIADLHNKFNENEKILESQKKNILDSLAATNIISSKEQDVSKAIQVFRQTLLGWAISGKLTKDWRKEKLNEESQESEDFPKSWNLEESKNIFSFVTSGSRNWSTYYSNEGAIFLRIGNLSRQSLSLDLSKITRVKLPAEIEGRRTSLQENDILISITGELGLISIIPPNFPEAYINQHIALARPKSNYYPKYIALSLLSDFCNKQLTEKGSGSVKAGLNLEDIKKVFIPIPSLLEQYEIVNRVEELFEMADKLQSQYDIALTYFSKLEDSVIKHTFLGEEVESDLEEESLENILKFIKSEKIKLEAERKVLNMKKAKNKNIMKKEFNKGQSIEDILKENHQLPVEEIWKNSVYFENKDVESFYEELISLADNDKIKSSFSDEKKVETIITIQGNAN